MIKKEIQQVLSKKDNLWEVYYILLHCYIEEPIYFNENIILAPKGEKSNNDFLEIIENISEPSDSSNSEMNKNWNQIKEMTKNFHEKKNPIALLIFKDVKAENTIEAREKTENIAQNIILTIGVITNSCIDLIGWMFQNNRGMIFNQRFPYYNPVSINVDELSEISNKILNKLDENYLVKLALRYENEALNDSELDFSLLKRWTALEFLGEEYSKLLEKDKLLSKSDITKITSFIISNVIPEKNEKIKEKVRNSVGHINHENAKDKIRDLLIYLNYPLEAYENNKDVLDIIYQNRNCITHNGGCYKYNENKEKCNGPKYCKESELDLDDLNGALSRILVHFIMKLVGYSFE